MQIILDMGSGKSCGNDVDYIDAMIDAVKEVDTRKHEVILKWQLFKNQPPNIPLDPLVFNEAYMYGAKKGYKVTASVFDKESLALLLHFDIPFVKIACRPDLYWLIGEVPRKLPVYASSKPLGPSMTIPEEWIDSDARWLACVPEYPANIADYPEWDMYSDHTAGFALFKRGPVIWEKHFVLERKADNPDSGPFAVTPEDLKDIL